jgi:hypothetical protein
MKVDEGTKTEVAKKTVVLEKKKEATAADPEASMSRKER